MAQVTIDLPEDLLERARRFAQSQGIALDQLIQDSIKMWLNRSQDPFFDDSRVWDGPVPPDLSINHDKYLYDDEEEWPR